MAHYYYDLIKTGYVETDIQVKRAIVIYIFSQGLFGIALGSILVFGGIPVIGKILGQISTFYDFELEITMRESFLINFSISFGFLFIFIFNRVLQDGWSSIKTGFKKARTGDVKK